MAERKLCDLRLVRGYCLGLGVILVLILLLFFTVLSYTKCTLTLSWFKYS